MFTKNSTAKKILSKLSNSKDNLYITGEAGTGKTTLIQEFITKSTKNIVVLAPTGMAAINIGGQTIHSFCEFNLDPPFKNIQDGKIIRIKNRAKLKKLDTLIIDEISMVRPDLMDAMDLFFRKNLDGQKPFGGLQLVLVGDHFQLPPILQKDEQAKFFQLYKTPYFFSASVYSKLDLKHFKLAHIYRQTDLKYIKLLNYLRFGISDPRLVNWINENLLYKNLKSKKNDQPIIIATRNIEVTKINRTFLEKLDQEIFSYKAVIEGDFSRELYPLEKYLVLKKDAQVMFVRTDMEKRWVNGTIGKVCELNKDFIVVTLENGKKVRVDQELWEICKFEFSEKTNRLEKIIVGSFLQYPLKLAWAVTIHKSQGQTFSKCIIDIGGGSFAFGQTYVAFSRCKSLEGLYLKSPISSRDIKCDPQIIEFEKQTAWNS
jgi:ATP-dependent DNA helicase PIF1